METEDNRRYPGAMRGLHWLIAVLVFAVWPLGLLIDVVRDDVKPGFYLVHESLGFLVLWLMLLRLGFRLTASVPAIAGPRVERLAANTVHGVLYALLIIVPLSGFIATNAHGFPLVWFGVIPVWSPVGKEASIARAASIIHNNAIWPLLALVAVHISAALFHHVIRRDRTLERML